MLPAHVRDPESAVFWILAWVDRLGGTYAPDDPVRVFQDATGAIVRIRVEGVVTFADGARLEVTVELDGPARLPAGVLRPVRPDGGAKLGLASSPGAQWRGPPPRGS